MIPFERHGEELVAGLESVEADLIASLVTQLTDLLGDAAPAVASDDPFARWASEFEQASPLDRSDPVVARLFPDACDDPEVAAEVRRLSEDPLRRSRLADAAVVLGDLEASEPGEDDHPLVVPVDHAEAWMRTLNGVRLALSVRLGIEHESDHDALERLPRRDPRWQLVGLYDWLGAVLESLLEALHGWD